MVQNYDHGSFRLLVYEMNAANAQRRTIYWRCPSHDACDKLHDRSPLVKNAQDELRPTRNAQRWEASMANILPANKDEQQQCCRNDDEEQRQSYRGHQEPCEDRIRR